MFKLDSIKCKGKFIYVNLIITLYQMFRLDSIKCKDGK